MERTKLLATDESTYSHRHVKVSDLRLFARCTWYSVITGRSRYLTHTLARNDVWVEGGSFYYMGRIPNKAFDLEKGHFHLDGPYYHYFVADREDGEFKIARTTQDSPNDFTAVVNSIVSIDLSDINPHATRHLLMMKERGIAVEQLQGVHHSVVVPNEATS
jgi:hypothetical protein